MFTRKTMTALGRLSAGEALDAPKLPLLIILDEVRSMHNVGSTFRTADAFGAAGIYLCGFTPAPPHRDIRKTALGAEETVAWQSFDTAEKAIAAARAAGYRIVAVEQAEGSSSLSGFEWSGTDALALVFGNEVEGVGDAALALADACIEIPQRGAKHSLNVSVSLGVVLWELVRMLQG